MPFPSEYRLILASGSPRRRELLDASGYRFRVAPPGDDAESGEFPHDSPEQLVARLALLKAEDVARRLATDWQADEILIACDTVADLAGQVLGKPRDREHAREMLRSLSGQEHRVHSGLCVWKEKRAKPRMEVATTHLQMDSLSAEEIDYYLDGGGWQGKAGAFGYQDRNDWLQILAGSESNVVGLPLELLASMLAALPDNSDTPGD